MSRFGRFRMSIEEAKSIYSDLQDSGDSRLQKIGDKFLPFINGEADSVVITHGGLFDN